MYSSEIPTKPPGMLTHPLTLATGPSSCSLRPHPVLREISRTSPFSGFRAKTDKGIFRLVFTHTHTMNAQHRVTVSCILRLPTKMKFHTKEKQNMLILPVQWMLQGHWSRLNKKRGGNLFRISYVLRLPTKMQLCIK